MRGPQTLRLLASLCTLALLSPLLYLAGQAMGQAAVLWDAWEQLNVLPLSLNTVALLAAAATVAVTLGLPLGVCLAETHCVGRAVVLTALVLSLLVPVEVHAMAWFAWFGTGGPAIGWGTAGGLEALLKQLLSATPLDAHADPVVRVAAAGWVHGWLGAVATALLVQLALRLCPQELRDAARLETTPRRAFWHIILPQAKWAVAAGALLTCFSAATEIAVVDLVQLITLADAVYVAFQLEGSWTAALAASCLLGPLMLLLLVPAVMVAKRALESSATATWAECPRPLWPGKGAACLGTLLAWLAATVALGFPCATMVYRATAFAATGLGELVIRSGQAFAGELAVTLGTATAAATVAMSIAVLWWCPGPVRNSLPLLVAGGTAAVAPPLAGLAVAHLAMATSPALYDSYIPLAWALAIRAFPFALVVTALTARAIPAELLEMARLEAGHWRSLFFVWLPLSAPGILAGWLLAATVAASDVAASVVAAPPGTPPLTVRLFTLLHYGFDDYVAGLGLWLVATLLPASGLALILLRVARQRTEEER